MRRPRPSRLHCPRFASVVVLVILVGVQRGAEAAQPQPYTVTIAKTGNAALDQALNDSSTLISLRDTAPVGPYALIARARLDSDRFVTALHSFGYYKGTATLTIAGHPLDDPDLPDLLDSAPAKPPVEVNATTDPGPLFHLGTVQIEGSVPEAARAQLDLKPGAPAVAADVLAAGKRLLTAMQNEGYALAEVGEPVALLDPAAQVLNVSFAATSGPRVDLGPVTVSGLEGVNEAFVRRRLLVRQGELYSPEALEKARADLVSTGVFSSVRLVQAEKLDAAGELPVTFQVTERPRHAVSLGAAYSTDLGVFTTATWTDRNLFGNAEQLNVTAGYQAGGSARPAPGYNFNVQFIKPDYLIRDQSLQIDAGAVKQTFEAYEQTALLSSVQLTRKLSDHWKGTIGISGETESVIQQHITRYYNLVGLPVSARYDSSNDLFEPTQGIRGTISATPTQSFGQHDVTFFLLQASGSTYFDMPWLGGAPGRSVLALRGLVGSAQGASQFELPPDKRFYAGGSATVRGYKFQSVGPQFPDETPEGGTGVAAATVEFRQRILQSWGMAVFADAGQVVASGSPFSGNWHVGVGAGARYYTPIGPVRLDFAIPLNKEPGGDSYEIYIGIGQAF